MSFRDQPRNTVAALRDLALILGPAARRDDKPVFVDEHRSPLSSSAMTTAMYKAMCVIVGSSRAKLFTWHSARISLATHLLRCKVPPATIQAMLRWQTDESLRAYARLSMQDCGAMFDSCAAANIAAVQTTILPLFEKFDFFLALHDMVETA